MTDSPTQAIPAADKRPDPSLLDILSPHIRIRILILAAAFIALHHDILLRIAHFARTDGDWSHAFLIPILSIIHLHSNREKLAAAAPRVCWAGLPIMLIGLAGYILSLHPWQNDMLKGYFMVLELFGLVLLLGGPAVMRVVWFPVLYLAFAVKITPEWWSALAHVLQHMAAGASVWLLNLLGYPASVSETAITLVHEGVALPPLNVAEACSGMRMLIAFVAMGVAVAFLAQRPWWSRLTLVAMTLPIAIFVNVCRVTTLGILYTVDPQYARGDFHLFIGMLLLLPGLGLFLLTGWGLSKLEGHN